MTKFFLLQLDDCILKFKKLLVNLVVLDNKKMPEIEYKEKKQMLKVCLLLI